MNEQLSKKLVPELRFKRDNGTDYPEWEIVKLSTISKRQTLKNKDENISRVLTNSATEGILDQRDYFDKDIANKSNLSNYFIVDKEDYVYNPRISSKAPVGPISKNKIGKGVMSPLYTVFRFNSQNNSFYECFFNSSKWHRYLQEISNIGARHDRMNITNDQFMNMPVPKVDPEEQKKVAECLSLIDELINLNIKKLEILNKYKKGFIQSLFPCENNCIPEIRFPTFRNNSQWVKSRMGQYIEILSGYPFKSTDISTDSKGIPLIRGINITEGKIRHNINIDRYYLGSINKLDKYKVKKNDLVIGMDGSKVGKNVALISEEDENSLLVQRVARLRSESITDIQFIFHHVNSKKFHLYVDRMNTSGGIPHISAKQIQDFEIFFPKDTQEKEKLNQFFFQLDEIISSQIAKLEKLELHKIALSQKLFPNLYEVN